MLTPGPFPVDVDVLALVQLPPIEVILDWTLVLVLGVSTDSRSDDEHCILTLPHASVQDLSDFDIIHRTPLPAARRR